MKAFFKSIVCSLFVLALHGSAFAADRGSADAAVALVKKAVVYLKNNGKEKAFAEFGNPNGQFRDRDLYIFVYDLNGKNVAHGNNPKLIGKNLIDLRDVDGRYIVKNFLEIATSKGQGWTDYKWPSPVTTAIELKSSYVEKVDDLVIGCGIYK